MERLNESNGSGTIFTRTLLFERTDLLSQCPKEVITAIQFMYKAEQCIQVGDSEGYRVNLEKSFDALRRESEVIK